MAAHRVAGDLELGDEVSGEFGRRGEWVQKYRAARGGRVRGKEWECQREGAPGPLTRGRGHYRVERLVVNERSEGALLAGEGVPDKNVYLPELGKEGR